MPPLAKSSGFRFSQEFAMSIIRVIKNSRHRFLISDVEIHNRKNISWEARGLHAYLMSKPDNWQVIMSELISAGPAGKDKMRRMLEELEGAGYLLRERIRDQETGQYVATSSFYERVDLNPEYTPTYGGNGEHQGGKSDMDQGGFTTVANPPLIKNNIVNKYKGDFRHFETSGPFEQDLPSDQEIHDMTIALVSVCKGFANLLVPDDCPFRDAAVTLLVAGRTEEEVMGFGDWWERNGTYEGQPALKSLMTNLDNSINGVEPGKKKARSAELSKAIGELDQWLARKIKPGQFSSPYTLLAIRGVGESNVRAMTTHNRGILLSKFETEFERAKQNGETERAKRQRSIHNQPNQL
jgi:hypothetical protein